jgi:glucose/arabinose dehydrogenase
LCLESLESRRLLTGGPPFAVGGDPIVNPADFRVTTFASGLNYPHGMTVLSDGSLLVAVNNPNGGSSFFDSTGRLLRFTDSNGDGVADDAGQILFDNLPGEVTALHQAGEFILATSSAAGSERISFLRTGATPSDSLTFAGSITFSFPANWEHTTFASVVRPTPGQSGNYDLIFNVGSEYNGVVIGSNGQVVLDSNGNPTYVPTTDTVGIGGLISGTLLGDSLYMVTIHDNGGTPSATNLTRIASGLRNAASLAIDPVFGDLYLADNGIDGNGGGNEAWSADELDTIPASQIGGTPQFFGFPEVINGQLTYSYVKTVDQPGDPVTVVNPGVGVQPLVAFEPLPDPVLTAEGSESEGSSGFALSPPQFPAGLNHGVFIGFHGVFDLGGASNDENPLVFANPVTGHYFDFVSNNETGIGHIDEVVSTTDSLFLADISSGGSMFGGAGQGMIYQITAIGNQPVNHPPVLAPIPDQTIKEGDTLSLTASATDPDAGQTITYSLGTGAPSGAQINAQSGALSWTPNAYAGSGMYSITVVATDNGSPPLSDSKSFNVTVLAVNHPPVVATIPSQLVEQSQPLEVDIRAHATDPDVPAQTLHFSLASGAPDGVSIGQDSGILVWPAPTVAQIGLHSIGVVVTDTGSPPLSTTATVPVNVVPFNHPPVLAAIATQTLDEGTLLEVTASATDSDVPAQSITYALGPGAPAGAAIDPQAGVLRWTPDAYAGSGTYAITITATDDGIVPKTASTTFSVVVLPVNHPPAISALPDRTVGTGQTLLLAVAGYVSDLDKPSQALQYSLAAGAPSGAAIDSSGVLTWTVSSSQHIGVYSIGVVVTDSGSPRLSASATVLVTVFDLGSPPTIKRASVRTKHGYAITLTFSQPLEPATAEDSSNYVLIPAKRKKQKSLPTPIPLAVRYDPRTHKVTLTALGRVNTKQVLKLTVIGTGPDGVAKVTGLLLAGSRGRSGTNYVATITGNVVRH